MMIRRTRATNGSMRSLRGLMFALCLGAGLAHAELGDGAGVGRDVAAASHADALDVALDRQRRLDADLAALAARERDLRTNLSREVRALYRLTRPGAAPFAAGFDALRAHVARVKRLERLAAAQAATLANLGNARARLRGEREQLDAALAEQRERLATQQAARATLEANMVAAALDDVAEQAPEPFYGLRIVDGPPLDAFETRKGDLPSPIAGEVRVLDARRAGGGPGLEFQATAGTPVRAVAAGRVALSDRRDELGRLVMLDHADGFYTVYAGLGRVDVIAGDDVSEGARLGTIGSDADVPALYFEVRRGDRALSPRTWLGF